MTELEIVLKLLDEGGLATLQSFGEKAKAVIAEIGQAERKSHQSSAQSSQQKADAQKQQYADEMAARKAMAAAIKAIEKDDAESARRSASERSQATRDSLKSQQTVRELFNEKLKSIEKDQVDYSKRSEREKLDARTQASKAWVTQQWAANEQIKSIEKDQAAESTRVAKETAATQQSMSVAMAYTLMRVSAEVGQGISAAMHAVADSVDQARDRIKSLFSDMEQARSRAGELLARTGKPMTAAETANLRRKAAAAGIKFDQYVDVANTMQDEAGQYIASGPEPPGGWTPGAMKKAGFRITQADAEDLQGFVANYAVGARHISASDATQLMGTVIAHSPAGTPADELKDRYVKLLTAAEKGRGKTSKLGVQIAQATMEGVAPDADFNEVLQTTMLARVESDLNPGETGTNVRAFDRAMRELEAGGNKVGKGDMAALGLAPGMDRLQQVAAIAGKLDEWKAANPDKDDDQFFQQFKGFREVRKFRSVQRAAQGMNDGSFRRVANEIDNASGAAASAEGRAYLAGQEGRSNAKLENLAAAGDEAAGKLVPLVNAQREALMDLITSGVITAPEGGIQSVLTKGGAAYGQGSFELQEANRLVIANTMRDLGQYEAGQQYLEAEGYATPPTAGLGAGAAPPSARRTLGIGSAPGDIAAVVAKLEELRQIAAQQRDAGDRGQPPLNAPPPNPRGRN